MKFVDFLNEMAATIKLSPEEIKDHIVSYDQLMKYKATKFGYIGDYDLLKTPTAFYAVDAENKKIVMYSRIAVRDQPSSKVLKRFRQQTMVWKENHITTKQFNVFFMYVLDEIGTIFGDESQTIGAQKFWKSLFEHYKGSTYYEIGYYDDANDTLHKFTRDDTLKDFDEAVYKKSDYNIAYIKMI